MPPMFELLAPMIVPLSQNWLVGGAVTVVWSRPAPWTKHHGFSVTCSLYVPGPTESRYCFFWLASVMLTSAAPIVGKVAPPGLTDTVLPPTSVAAAFSSWAA